MFLSAFIGLNMEIYDGCLYADLVVFFHELIWTQVSGYKDWETLSIGNLAYVNIFLLLEFFIESSRLLSLTLLDKIVI